MNQLSNDHRFGVYDPYTKTFYEVPARTPE